MIITVFGILFLDDRGKNAQSILDLEITPAYRQQIIASLEYKDYSEGPMPEAMRGILPMWVFGRNVKGREMYIKISLGSSNNSAVCISFHIAEQRITYPYKKR